MHGQTVPRDKCWPLARSYRSTWQGRGIPPSVAFFPSATSGGNGNPAGFHTFPRPFRLPRLFTGTVPMNKTRTQASGRPSEQRQRVYKVDTRWDEIEYIALLAAAQSTGLTRGGYLRALVTGHAGPRAQRAPSYDARALAVATAALNRVGSNLNQIARVLNAGAATITAGECHAVLDDVRDAVAGILDVVGREARR